MDKRLRKCGWDKVAPEKVNDDDDDQHQKHRSALRALKNKRSDLLIKKAHKTAGNTEVWLVHRCNGFLGAKVA